LVVVISGERPHLADRLRVIVNHLRSAFQ
jgi:hypothetical protein